MKRKILDNLVQHTSIKQKIILQKFIKEKAMILSISETNAICLLKCGIKKKVQKYFLKIVCFANVSRF